MSFSTLYIGSSALLTAQRAVDVASHNVANANTPGYTRQRLEVGASRPAAGTIGARGTGMMGTGVQVLDVNRLRDQLADASFRVGTTRAGAATARSGLLDQAQGILGPYGEGTPQSLSAFWKSMDQLALSPSDPAARSGALDAANTVAESLRTAHAELSRIDADGAARVGADVEEVNQLTARVARLNDAIADAVTSAQEPNDLLDQRDQAVDRLATLTGATVRPTAMRGVDVFLGGATLVQGTSVRQLQAVSVPSGGSLGGVPAVRFDDGSLAAVDGEIGGYVRAAAVDLPSFAAKLDQFATDFASAVNAVHAAPGAAFDLYGAQGGALFTATGAGDIAVAITDPKRLAAAATQTPDPTTGAPGPTPHDGTNAVRLADLRNQQIGGVTLGDKLGAVASTLGSAAAGSASDAVTANTTRDSADKLRAAASGVSVDEEMVELVKYQHSYSAAARVISIADSMLDTLINGTIGR